MLEITEEHGWTYFGPDFKIWPYWRRLLPDERWLLNGEEATATGSAFGPNYDLLLNQAGFIAHVDVAFDALYHAYDWDEFSQDGWNDVGHNTWYLTPTFDGPSAPIEIFIEQLYPPHLRLYPEVTADILRTIATAHPLFTAMLPWVEPLESLTLRPPGTLTTADDGRLRTYAERMAS